VRLVQFLSGICGAALLLFFVAHTLCHSRRLPVSLLVLSLFSLVTCFESRCQSGPILSRDPEWYFNRRIPVGSLQSMQNLVRDPIGHSTLRIGGRFVGLYIALVGSSSCAEAVGCEPGAGMPPGRPKAKLDTIQ